MWVCGVFVSTIKTKNPDCSDLKLGTVVVLDNISKPIDFGFKRSKVRLRKSSLICVSRECTFLPVRYEFITEQWPPVLNCTTI